MKKLMKAYFAKLVISWKKNPKKTQKGQINFASFRLRWMRRKIRAEWMEVQVKILKKNFSVKYETCWCVQFFLEEWRVGWAWISPRRIVKIKAAQKLEENFVCD